MRWWEMLDLGMPFNLKRPRGQQAEKRSRHQYLTSRMARKKDSILPAERPRAGAVCNKTEPMALHEGYAS